MTYKRFAIVFVLILVGIVSHYLGRGVVYSDPEFFLIGFFLAACAGFILWSLAPNKQEKGETDINEASAGERE